MSASFGDVFDAVGAAVSPTDPAICCDDALLTWSDFNRASNSFARALILAGLQPDAKLAQYMRNSPEYLISFVGAFKARVAPVNVNYRYGPDELFYLMDNCDAEAVIFDASFADHVRALKPRLPAVKLWISVGARVEGCAFFGDLAAGDGSPLGIERSASDMFLLYTGGTTGLPKGVMWPSDAWWEVLAMGRAEKLGMDPPATLEALAAQIRTGRGRAPYFAAPPLMHGTGLFTAIGAMSKGAPIVVTRSAHFDAVATLDTMTRLRCGGLSIVGDAFGRRLLDALRAEPERYELSCVETITSSGMMWSPEVKRGMLEFMPNASLMDSFGASEGTGLGASITTRDTSPEDAKFEIVNTIVVRPEDLTPITPGSGEIGLVAKWGNLPLGYYKDPEKSARTWVMIGGVRHLISGDHATVEADGKIRLLGRGSHCINSAGEKIYPEEVEEALKTHPAVADALVFGQPDPQYGQTVAAVASWRAGASVSEAELIAHVRERLSHYKAPRRIVLAAVVPRAPNGKADYAAAKEVFAAAV